MQVTKEDWNRWAAEISQKYPYLAVVMSHSRAQTGEDGVVLQFNKKDKLFMKFADTYLDTISDALQEITGQEIKVQTGVTGE